MTRHDPATLKPCGTNAAYQRHNFYGEDVDDACIEAHRVYHAAYVRRHAVKRAAIREESGSQQMRAMARLMALHRAEYLWLLENS